MTVSLVDVDNAISKVTLGLKKCYNYIVLRGNVPLITKYLEELGKILEQVNKLEELK